MTNELHAHFESTSIDCDSRYDREYVLQMNDDELASDFGDIEFHERVAAGVGSFYASYGGTLTVEGDDDGNVVAFEFSERTEEGSNWRRAVICRGDCDLGERSFRDHTAESMGY